MDIENAGGSRFKLGMLVTYFSLFSRLALGGVFIFAGIAKLPHIQTLTWEIEQYQILPGPLVTVYAHALPYLEIILGTLLVLGIYLRVSAAVSGLLVLSFTLAKVTALARGLDIDICPCFGPAVPLLLVSSLAVDFALLILALRLILYRGNFLSLGPRLKKYFPGPSSR